MKSCSLLAELCLRLRGSLTCSFRSKSRAIGLRSVISSDGPAATAATPSAMSESAIVDNLIVKKTLCRDLTEGRYK